MPNGAFTQSWDLKYAISHWHGRQTRQDLVKIMSFWASFKIRRRSPKTRLRIIWATAIRARPQRHYTPLDLFPALLEVYSQRPIMLYAMEDLEVHLSVL
jgi:hypothetical protein